VEDNCETYSYLVRSENAPVFKAQVLDSGVADEFFKSKTFDNFALTVSVTTEENKNPLADSPTTNNDHHYSSGFNYDEYTAVDTGLLSALTADEQAIDVDEIFRHARCVTVMLVNLKATGEVDPVWFTLKEAMLHRMHNLEVLKWGLSIRGPQVKLRLQDSSLDDFHAPIVRNRVDSKEVSVGDSRKLSLRQEAYANGRELEDLKDSTGRIIPLADPRLPSILVHRHKIFGVRYYSGDADHARFPLWSPRTVCQAFPHRICSPSMLACLDLISDDARTRYASTATQLKTWQEESNGQRTLLRKRELWSAEEEWRTGVEKSGYPFGCIV
jgi:hypothetical protein